MHFLPLWTIKPVDVQMNHAQLLVSLTSLPVSHAILPPVVLSGKPNDVVLTAAVDKHLSQSENVY